MLQPDFYPRNELRSGLTQVFELLKRITLSCLCVENCRLCARELSLAPRINDGTDQKYKSKPTRSKQDNRRLLLDGQPGGVTNQSLVKLLNSQLAERSLRSTFLLDGIGLIKVKAKQNYGGKDDPEAAFPEAAFPDAVLPDAARPDAARPDAARPDAARPDAFSEQQDQDQREQVAKENAVQKKASPRDAELKTSNVCDLSSRNSISARAPDQALSSFFETITRLTAELKNRLVGYRKELALHMYELYRSVLVANQVRPTVIFFPQQTWLFPRLSECICEECFDELKIDLPLLGFCQLHSGKQSTLTVASGAPYDDYVRLLMRQFKHDGDRLLCTDLAGIMSNGWHALKEFMPATEVLLVPVPLHHDRQQSRGFNQSQLLACELKKYMNLMVDKRALKRTRHTKSQQLLSGEERKKNVHGAFIGEPRRLAGKSVVLIDDVCTSGSTLVECAEEVLRCGAKSVTALTVARAILSKSDVRSTASH